VRGGSRNSCARTTMVNASSFAQLRCMQPILLEVPEGDNTGTYPSLVLDFTEGESLIVGVPLERGREVRIGPETPVNVQIVRPDGMYVMPSRVLQRDARAPALLLGWPARQDRVQRRNHVRVDVMVQVDVWIRATEGTKVGEEARRIGAVSIDLSAGGVRLALPEPLEVDTQVRVQLRLPDGEAANVEARVLRIGETAEAKPSARHWAAVEFVGMLESVRKEITRYVFDIQRDQLRKGVA
jgi:c-di-GMP-binding flagellar brake protein YcgR